MNRSGQMTYRTATLILLALGIALSGCSSPIPALIKQVPPGDIQVEEVQQQPDGFVKSKVRWGGNIMLVENLADRTLIEVLSRKLGSNGKPDTNSSSKGRFRISLEGFIEPEEFPKDRLITVHGDVVEVMDGVIGAYRYQYPVVKPDSYYLWPEERKYSYHDHYDPFYYPYYPYWYRRYPYYWY